MNSLTKSRRHFFRIGAIVLAGVAARAATATAAPRNVDPDNDGDVDRGRHHHHDVDHHCFRAGTKIRTVDGDVRIEDLKPGDRLWLLGGDTGEVQEVVKFPVTSPSVLIFPDALEYKMPSAPLFVSSMHALAIDGVLVTAGSLINGATIIGGFTDDSPYYHVRLARHGVIYAENAPCETLRGEDEEPCLPLHSAVWRREQIASHARSALSPIIDVRRPMDVIRDRLEERAFA